MPGRGVLAIVAVTRSRVSPLRTKTAPLACSATRPVSKLMERSPTRCSMILGSGVMGLLARPPRGLARGQELGATVQFPAPLSPITDAERRPGRGRSLSSCLDACLPPTGGGPAAQRGTGSGRYPGARDSPTGAGDGRPVAAVQGACDDPWGAA